MHNPLPDAFINSLPNFYFLAHQHPSGVKVVEKLVPAPIKDPYLNYLGDIKLLGLVLATEARIGQLFTACLHFPYLPYYPHASSLLQKMRNISATQEVLAAPHLQ